MRGGGRKGGREGGREGERDNSGRKEREGGRLYCVHITKITAPEVCL